MAKALLGIFCLLVVATHLGGIFWGHGYFFHPDENNMAWAVMSFQKTGDPHFYAYGEFPILLVAEAGHLLAGRLSFAEAIYGLRILSALAGLALIGLAFLWSRRACWQPVWLFPFLVAFSPGLIQAAHFGTTETLLTLMLLATIYLLDSFAQGSRLAGWGLALVSGMAAATKISAFSFILPAWLVLFYFAWRRRQGVLLLKWLLLALATMWLLSPIYWQNPQAVWRTLRYEGRVAQGAVHVFYTWQFANTWPVIFQLRKVFPWVLGLPLYLLFFPALVTLIRENRRIWRNGWLYLPVLGWGSNLFLLVKWVRFSLPLVPFIIMVVSWFWQCYYGRRWLFIAGFIFLILPGLLFASLYFQPDIRWRVSQWLDRLPAGTVLLEETGNVYPLPLTDGSRLRILTVDSYHLDTSAAEQRRLRHFLPQADRIVIASRRVFANYLPLKGRFPQTAGFYTKLFSGRLGFGEEKVFTPWPRLINAFLGGDLASEETWTVFDHPTVRIWTRVKKD